MTTEQFLSKIKEYQEKGFTLIKNKNSDYAGIDNPFKNFNACNAVNVSAEVGILVRMMDKICRAGNLINKEAAVKDEKIEDTLIDLANYSYILLSILEDKKNKPYKSDNPDFKEWGD